MTDIRDLWDRLRRLGRKVEYGAFMIELLRAGSLVEYTKRRLAVSQSKGGKP